MKIKFDCEFIVKIILVLGVIYLMTKCCLEKSLENMANIKPDGLKNIVLSNDKKTYVLARAKENNDLKFIDLTKIRSLEEWVAIRFKLVKVNPTLFRLETQDNIKTLVKMENTNKAALSDEENNILFFRQEINDNDDDNKTINYFGMNVIKLKKRIIDNDNIFFQNNDVDLVLASGELEGDMKEVFLLDREKDLGKERIEKFRESWKIKIRENIF